MRLQGVMEMYQIGDRVVYGIHGVCCVANLENRMVDGVPRVYLVLEPVGQNGSRFLVPSHNAAAMGKLRPMLSREQIPGMLRSALVHTDRWIQEENRRKQAYRELFSCSDSEKLMQMVCTLYRHKRVRLSAGRKVHQCDDNFLRDAEKLLSGEIALAMEMEYDRARSYLREELAGE